jgi:hypothetical protein
MPPFDTSLRSVQASLRVTGLFFVCASKKNSVSLSGVEDCPGPAPPLDFTQGAGILFCLRV